MTSSHADPRTGSTGERILDAALDVVQNARLRDLTIEDVATAAGVSRQTVYRYHGTREGLIRALVIREEARLARGARDAVRFATSLEDATRLAVQTLLEGVRQHPLIDRLIADDPETLLPYLTLGQGPVLDLASEIVADLVGRFVPDRTDLIVDVADVLSRLVVSYTIAPGDRSPAEVGEIAARMVEGGLAGPRRTR